MITIELKDQDVDAALSGLQALLADLTPVMNEIGDFLVTSTKGRFKAGVDPDGNAWAPRSPATLANYKRRGINYGPKPLLQSGDMGQQIFHAYDATSVQVGSNAIQAAVMQFGAAKGAFGANKAGRPIPWGNIPARPFLGLSESDKSGVIEIVGEWLERAAGGDPA